MEGLTLLAEARAAGLTVLIEGDQLVIRGPKKAAALARQLLNHKEQIMAALDRPNRPDRPADPEQPPPGTVIYLQDEHGRPTDDPAEAWMWTWSGGNQWQRTNERPVPKGYTIDPTRWSKK